MLLHTHKHVDTQKPQPNETAGARRRQVCVYIYIYMYVYSYYDSYNRRLLTHSEKRDGDSAGSTQAFRGVESASRKPAQNNYGEDRGEEFGFSLAALRPP